MLGFEGVGVCEIGLFSTLGTTTVIVFGVGGDVGEVEFSFAGETVALF